MAAENASLGGSARLTTTLSRRQFSLRSLFIFSLRISPLFLAILFLREGISFQTPNAAMFFNVLACAAVYGGILSARAEIRRLQNLDTQLGRSILPAIRNGAFNGALFLSMAFGPAIFAQLLRSRHVLQAIEWLLRFWSPLNLLELFRRLGGLLVDFAPVLGFLAFLGFFLGAMGGAVAGLFIEFRKQRRPAGGRLAGMGGSEAAGPDPSAVGLRKNFY